MAVPELPPRPAAAQQRRRATGFAPIAPIHGQPWLSDALQAKLRRRHGVTGYHGELEAVAIRLGLIQNTVKPRLRSPQLLVVAGDHGLAVDLGRGHLPSSATQVSHILGGRVPMAAFAFQQRVGLTVVDAGLAEDLPPTPTLVSRKIAYGTHNTRLGLAMSTAQAEAGLRAGLDIVEGLPGNLLACAGVGVGSMESAALILCELGRLPLRELLVDPHMTADRLSRMLVALQGAQKRHLSARGPIEVLCAFGGHEIAVLAGAMIAAAGQRRTLLIDGLPACAALALAARLAPSVVDYAFFARSSSHPGLDQAFSVFHANALLELDLDAPDGTGAVLAWPMLSAAAALLGEISETVPSWLPELPVITDEVSPPPGAERLPRLRSTLPPADMRQLPLMNEVPDRQEPSGPLP